MTKRGRRTKRLPRKTKGLSQNDFSKSHETAPFRQALTYYYKKTQVEYTAYGAKYQVYLPMNLEIIIPSGKPVRLLNVVMEELDYRRLTAAYSRLGKIEYSPHPLFKIVLYGCLRGIYAMREMFHISAGGLYFSGLQYHCAVPQEASPLRSGNSSGSNG